MSTLKWAIVGCSDITNKAAAPAMVADAHSSIVAFYSHDLQRAEQMRRTFGAATAYDDLPAMLADPRIEAVYVGSPPHRHAAEASAALEAGKHVLCEKPMALSIEDCRRMNAAARAGDVHLAIAYYRRFWPKARKMKALISRGAIGRPVSARIRVGRYYNPDPDDIQAWRVRVDQAGGGALLDVGSHRLDVMCWLLGMPQRAAGAMATLSMDYEVPDTETLICVFDSGAQLVCEASWNVDTLLDEFEVRGTEATLIATPFDAGQTLILDRYGETEQLDCLRPEGNRHGPMIEDFSIAVTEGRAPAFDGSDGMLATAVISAAYRSWRSGRWEVAT